MFRVIKRQFGFTQTRYRGLIKNVVQAKHAGAPGESVFAEKTADGPSAGAVRPPYSKRAMKR